MQAPPATETSRTRSLFRPKLLAGSVSLRKPDTKSALRGECDSATLKKESEIKARATSQGYSFGRSKVSIARWDRLQSTLKRKSTDEAGPYLKKKLRLDTDHETYLSEKLLLQPSEARLKELTICFELLERQNPITEFTIDKFRLQNVATLLPMYSYNESRDRYCLDETLASRDRARLAARSTNPSHPQLRSEAKLSCANMALSYQFLPRCVKALCQSMPE